MATSNITITVQTRVRGIWRAKVAVLVLRWLHPERLAARVACWLLDGKLGVDTKVGGGGWERGPRVKVVLNGDR